MLKLSRLIFIVLIAAVATAQQLPKQQFYVHFENGRAFLSKDAVNPYTGAAFAASIQYTPNQMATGWDILNVTTSPAYSDAMQAYAAGFGEGATTYASVWDNFIDNFNGTEVNFPQHVQQWLDSNWRWVKQQVAANNLTSAYWFQVGLQVRQFEGLQDGLNSVAPRNQTFSTMMVLALQTIGDMYDLSPALNPPMGEDWRRMSKEEYELWLAKKTRCSALVKLAYDLSDIFFGHATWSTYNTMLRSYKHYTLNYASSVSKEVSFSGYPGLLSSLDDFYVTDQWLTVMETSIAIINTSMYDGNIRTESS
jgi:hypothetical protein